MDNMTDKVFSGKGHFASREELMELLCSLDRDVVTGALILKFRQAERSVFFDMGRIVFAHTNRFEDSLGLYLLSKRVINREQLESASKAVRDTEKRLGRVLLEMKLLDYDTLWKSVSGHLLSIVFACFQEEVGEYTLIPGHCLPDENILMNMSIGNLVWEVMRRSKIPKETNRYLEDLKKIYITDLSKVEQIDMTPYERHVIRLIDRHHTLEDIVASSELLPDDTRRILAVLRMNRLISGERSDSQSAAADPSKSSGSMPFTSFNEALKHYNTLFEMIFKMLKKEIGPIALSISQNSLEEIRESLPGPFKKAEIMPDGKLNDQLLQKTIWFGDMNKKMEEFISALDEILYAQIFAVKKNLGNEHEQQVLRWVRGDRN